MAVPLRQIYGLLLVLLLISGSCVSAVHGLAPEQCSHGHDHHHHHHHGGGDEHEHAPPTQCNHGGDHHRHGGGAEVNKRTLLPEELAEEEDLKLYGFGRHLHHHHHDHGHLDSELSGLGLWLHAMSCSLLVSLASLVCLIILPLIFWKGKPSKTIVDSLALFGAGAMLGDAFLHQLPHAFGGNHSHSESHVDHSLDHDHSGHSHSHSLKDLSVGLSILAGIVLFLIVEKFVRYVEELSGGFNAWGHGHHHHKHSKKLKDDKNPDNDLQGLTPEKTGSLLEKDSGRSEIDGQSAEMLNGEKDSKNTVLRKRNTGVDGTELETNGQALNFSKDGDKSTKEPAKSQSSLVFGYLNLFSDGVHNFTDGMALGSAFLLYGSVGGWSRTLFLLAHELPQEIGDFGILVRSGFSVSKALFFNFLSALVALAGTALALVLGQDPGQSSLIEGFTAGGFIYVAVAGVLAESNSGSLSMKSTVIQLISLLLGMIVALSISLVE